MSEDSNNIMLDFIKRIPKIYSLNPDDIKDLVNLQPVIIPIEVTNKRNELKNENIVIGQISKSCDKIEWYIGNEFIADAAIFKPQQ
jgi:hypothetical protein